MIQFMKAMRDEKGDMVRNAHILGFFRRICKLLFLRTKPVFVFDGGTPALKRRTVIARRRQRENAQTKIRKTAEKLLLNHLKTMKLKELADDLKNQRKNHDAKGKKVLNQSTENKLKGYDTVSRSYNQEELDEMLAASIAAEEDVNLNGNGSTSGAGMLAEEEDDDEEMILPTMHGKVDPTVLAALPPSMQLDLLVQMRERLMAENRQKYQKVKQAPAKFSELQIQAYLKTVAFRREINEVQKTAAGKGVGGVQTSRIASEANREFIFSSSFTGDKQMLTSAGAGKNDHEQHQMPVEHPSSESVERIASSSRLTAASGSGVDEQRKDIHDGVETYLDERGRVRVSRVRAMGIRMTRDLQRNLDLMREIEQEKSDSSKILTEEFVLLKDYNDIPRESPNKSQFSETSREVIDVSSDLNDGNEHSMSRNGVSMEISFENDGEHNDLSGDDELFAHLVAGDPVLVASVDNTSAKKQSSGSSSEYDWEEGVIEQNSGCFTHNDRFERQSSPMNGNFDVESDVEWEEGTSDAHQHASSHPAKNSGYLSKGVLKEEADLQEALRRSIEDLSAKKSVSALSEVEKCEELLEMTLDTSSEVLYQENDKLKVDTGLQNAQEPNELSIEIVAGVPTLSNLDGIDVMRMDDISERQLDPPAIVSSDSVDILLDRPCEKYPDRISEILREDATRSEDGVIRQMEQTISLKEDGGFVAEQPLETSIGGGQMSICSNSGSVVRSHGSGLSLSQVPEVKTTDSKDNDYDVATTNHYDETTLGESFVNESTTKVTRVENLSDEKNHGEFLKEIDDRVDKSSFKGEEQIETTEARLEEEMLILGKERLELGEEQRKLERNMDSASSEMFAECQELLQMFGLPYIIAPMEAEAQCAYMELANLVDGVVTDDSDAFLFGARSVFKNIFDDRKYVETYFMKDIENELGLTREKLVHMALLLGSDYTEGVSGIGIVNAIEVVNAFSEEDGLQKFREWIESPDPTILGQFDVQAGLNSRKRVSKVGSKDGASNNIREEQTADQNVSHPAEMTENMKLTFMDKHRNVSKNWHIPSSFPSKAVISAYASPQVDKSTDSFSWGKPDLFVLRKLCWEKFGWGSKKSDELLLPVLKEYNKHETQLRLEAFYTFNERFAKIRSTRIQKAVKGITGKKSLGLVDDSVQEGSESRKKRRVNLIEPGVGKPGDPLAGNENGDIGDESNYVEKSTAKRSRKKSQKEPSPSSKGSSKRGRGGGRGRGRGRGKGQTVGRGNRKDYGSLNDETSSTDGNNSNLEEELEVGKSGTLQETRRSARHRKAVKYTEDDLEIAKSSKSDKNPNGEELMEEEPCQDHGVARDGDGDGDGDGGPSNKNWDQVGPHLPDVPCGGYFGLGGGFCADDEEQPDIETNQQDSNQGVDPSLPVEPCKEYLKIGGGFCFNEDDENDMDLDKKTSSEDRTTENVGSLHHSDPVVERNDDTDSSSKVQNLNDDDHLKAADASQKMIKDDDDDSGTRSSARFLSAMPNLRRKKRKT